MLDHVLDDALFTHLKAAPPLAGLNGYMAECIPGALEARVTVLAADRVDFDLFVPAANCDDAPASHGFLACEPSQLFAWNFAWKFRRRGWCYFRCS